MGSVAAKTAGFWESIAAGVTGLCDNIQCLMRHCAELNLQPEHASLAETYALLTQWRVRIAIVGGRHSGKTTLLNSLLGRRVFETGGWPVPIPVVRAQGGTRGKARLRLADGYQWSVRWESHREFLAQCADAAPGALESVSECTFYLDEPALRHAEFIEMSAPGDLLRCCDLILLTVSATAPLLDGTLEFVHGFAGAPQIPHILAVVTNTGELNAEGSGRIVEHVGAGLAKYGLPVFRLDAEEPLQNAICAALERGVMSPTLAGAAAEVDRSCRVIESAAAFAEEALRLDSAAYARAHETAVSDLLGLNRAIVEFEEALARGNIEIQQMLPGLTQGLLEEMERTAAERIEAAEAAANPEATLMEANAKALGVLQTQMDYACKEVRHAVARSLSELLRIRSSAEIRVQEIADNFLGSELGASLTGAGTFAAPGEPAAGMPQWLAAQNRAWMAALGAPPAYQPQPLASIRQIFSGGLKNCLARHWEIAGAPAESLTTILRGAALQFLRAPAEAWLAEMRRVSQALHSTFQSRRLALLAAPADPETRAVLAKVNADRRAECAAIRAGVQELIAGEKHHGNAADQQS
jgi:hypothetical protein